MARPQKTGLEYFPLDVDIDSDERVEFILAKHGFMAFGILIKLLMEIYRQGYYITWTERLRYVFAKRVNVDSMYTETVVSAYINEGIFEKKLFDEYGILTSHGVQARYLQASGRRVTVEMIKEFCLLDPKELPKTPKITFINVSVCKNPSFRIHNDDGNGDNCDITPTKTPQSKVKESNKDVVVTPYNPPQKGDEDMELETEVTEKDEATANVFTLFENNIHPITGQIETDTLSDLLDHYGEHWTTEAIKEAALRNGRSVKYIQSILEAWERDGFKAPKPERSKANERGLQSTRRKNQCQPGEGGDVPDSLKEFYADIEEVKNRPKPWEVQRPDGTGI
ncbi:Lin1244/Lin1753 domain-containing protein [Selenomonas ruminantium]|uniref:Lin1244/Lin1753 domain-containing protein n=1 Tax=Selenomonas ruminantium TaxID=971 RepID=UPI000944F6AD|nr:Lin1244/Lin1753 domain-containing protein [Selenomonas ruminantium]